MPFTHAHALIIGVGSYRHEPQMNVLITAADAPSWSFVLFVDYRLSGDDPRHIITANRERQVAYIGPGQREPLDLPHLGGAPL